MPASLAGGRGHGVLAGSLGRRALLKGAGGAALAALAAACAPASTGSPTSGAAPTGPSPAGGQPAPISPPAGASPTGPAAAAPSPAAASPAALASPAASPAAGGPETVYVFNVGSRDVTLIDAATRQTKETRPLGAQVRWLSNQQVYWDGQLVWTYDFPDNRLQAIAIDPRAVAVARTIPNIGTGPGHSLMLLPDRRRAAVNVAGDNVIALLDLASGQVEATIKTGAFP